jgi:hypothetical protein
MDQPNTDHPLNAAEKEVEEKIEKLIDDWLSGKIESASSFGILAVINWLEKKWCGYQQYDELKPNIGIIIGCVSGKRLPPKEKQQVKEKLQKIKRVWNDYEGSKAEKEQDVATIFDEIEGLLIEIIGLVTQQ